MSYSTYKLINEDTNKGVWMSELELLKLIKVTLKRNTKVHKKLIEHYEYLENKKFSYSKLEQL